MFGSGTIGIGAAIALKYLGCAKLLVVDLSDFRLKIAADLGFEACNSSKEDLKTKAMQVFGSARSLTGPTADVDIFIEAAGAETLISTYQAIGKLFSRRVVVAVLADQIPVNFV